MCYVENENYSKCSHWMTKIFNNCPWLHVQTNNSRCNGIVAGYWCTTQFIGYRPNVHSRKQCRLLFVWYLNCPTQRSTYCIDILLLLNKGNQLTRCLIGARQSLNCLMSDPKFNKAVRLATWCHRQPKRMMARELLRNTLKLFNEERRLGK